jgi:hypothetical protein
MFVIIEEVMEWQGWQKLSWFGSSVTGFILFAHVQWAESKNTARYLMTTFEV